MLELTKVTVGEHEYSIEKINAMKQFHIVRRLGPIIASAIPKGASVGELKGFLETDVSSLIPDLAEALASIKDEDAEFVLYGLLSACRRKEPKGLGWANVVVNNSLMYQDMSMPDMLKLAFHSGKVNLRDFSNALPSSSTGANQTPSSQ